MASKNVLVTIPQGTLKGLKDETVFGDVYYSFQGIPYGKPPVGELRFKAPEPADGWTGIRDATKPGTSSPTLDMLAEGGPKLLSSSGEDCLFLNVFAKHKPERNKKYPVLVWIHGGGYTVGNGNKETGSPDYFMSHDVILVTLNYRLGALGFLSLQTPECPGNYGLKDQRLALRWVQKNISYFGGDPDNVTIFGISAGGSSVHNLTSSPSCKGLFKRAIGQSGSSRSSWGYSLHPRKCAYLLGERLGCNAKNDEELLNFLKNCSPLDILLKSAGIWAEVEGQRVGEKQILNFSFTPTCEPESEETIILNEPMTKGNQLDIPYITGVTDKEMLIEIYNEKEVPKWTDDKDFQQLIPRELNVEKDSELSLKIARKIRTFFFKDKEVDQDGLIDALSDIHFVHGVHRAIKHRVTNDKIKSPTYAYVFSYEGEKSFIKMAMETFFGLTGFSGKGVRHGDDTSYFLAIQMPKMVLEPGTPDYETMKKWVQMWINFATTGEPTDEKSEVKWQPIDTKNDNYLEIGKKLELKKGFFKERMEFWDEIYRLAGKEPYSNNE